MFARTGATLAAVSLLTLPAFAAPIAYEPFNGTPGGTIIGTNGGTGWSSGWTTASSPANQFTFVTQSLSYTAGDVAVSGGPTAVQISGGTVEVIGSRAFPTQSGPVWVSFLFNTPTSAGLTDDFIQVGLDNAVPALGSSPRTSLGHTSTNATDTTNTEFFARSSTATTVFSGVTPAWETRTSWSG